MNRKKVTEQNGSEGQAAIEREKRGDRIEETLGGVCEDLENYVAILL